MATSVKESKGSTKILTLFLNDKFQFIFTYVILWICTQSFQNVLFTLHSSIVVRSAFKELDGDLRILPKAPARVDQAASGKRIRNDFDPNLLLLRDQAILKA